MKIQQYQTNYEEWWPIQASLVQSNWTLTIQDEETTTNLWLQ